MLDQIDASASIQVETADVELELVEREQRVVAVVVLVQIGSKFVVGDTDFAVPPGPVPVPITIGMERYGIASDFDAYIAVRRLRTGGAQEAGVEAGFDVKFDGVVVVLVARRREGVVVLPVPELTLAACRCRRR